ncbi:NAD kinase [Phycicoccus endophyticus]|uniref:NAD kinase n=1 Tax=Phycicoccus endophyticus TaxID=1690220 RepID=A0A7G9R457_9MICO|nr:NAD kinase [Phycicoccus endophyticus]NHI18228.1 NAD kinase [Phycicoccus endophyticus]QNN50382.1 NAD kinase [Phycicoccus endophyticus]GGL25338.1 NAD kinase 2 [Phycicoccus endophyticus]
MTSPSRRVLLVTHATRPDAQELAAAVASRLLSSGIGVCAPLADLEDTPLGAVEGVGGVDERADGIDCELVCVLGGDGTILRGAELSRGSGAPLLGVNLGHVGFLAEAEREDLDATVERICARDYRVEERMTLDVRARRGGELVFSSWALNEVSVEKAARERMLELTVEIGGRPLSTWGCDGVVVATPTGSTAYAFSAGGPVVWPDVEALLVVPISAHALFARPVLVGPETHVALQLLPDSDAEAVLWCDGRRAVALPPGAQVEVERSGQPVRLARLSDGGFTDRLVEKFHLPVHGWRGGARSQRPGEGPTR